MSVVWTVLIILAVICPVVGFIWLVRRGISVFRVMSGFDFSSQETKDDASQPAPRRPGPTGDLNTLTAARVERHLVKQTREENRQRRLADAKQRWAEHGLVHLGKFDSARTR